MTYYRLVLIISFVFFITSLTKAQQVFIDEEVRIICKCKKIVNRKNKKEVRKNSRTKSQDDDWDRIFSGFSTVPCKEKRRSDELKKYISTLDDDELIEFRKKVFKNVERKQK